MVATELLKKIRQVISIEASLTPTQQKMWGVLSDGKPHTLTELSKGLWDELSDPIPSVKNQVSRLRDVIIPEGYEVLGRTIQGESCFILVKFLVPQPLL